MSEKWYSCYLAQFEVLHVKSKEIFNILSRKHIHERVSEWFEILKKINEVWKPWDLSIPRYIICGGSGKKLSRFRNFFTYNAYKRKHLRRRITELRRMGLGLEWKWRSNLSSTSKVFLLFTYNMWHFILKFGIFLYLFVIFNKLIAFQAIF